jgi:hypothetical protein
MNQENKQLNEISLDDIKNYGHIGLDVVSVVSSIFPGAGTTVSIVADLMNALWYYSEGKKVTAGLYTIMAIPIVGDIFALPIQAGLKLGGKGLSKIPGIKQAMSKLVEKSPFVLKYLEKLIGFKATSPVAVSAKELVEKIVEKFGKAETEEAVKIAEKESAELLEKSLVKELEGGASKAVPYFTEKAAERLVIATKSGLKRILPKMAGDSFDGSDVTPTPSPSPTPKPIPGGGGKKIKWRKCQDTEMKKGCFGDNVRVLQSYLNNMGYSLGVDAKFGSKTEAMLRKFQKENGLSVTGKVDQATLDKIEEVRTGGTRTTEQTPIPNKSSKEAITTAPEKKESEKETLKTITEPTEKTPKARGFLSRVLDAQKDEESSLKGKEEKPWDLNTKNPNLKESLTRKRNNQIEQLVFERLVKGCK